MTCGVIYTASQEQINEIMGGIVHSDKEASILFSRMAISLQDSVKKCVPKEWNIDFVTRNIIFQQNDSLIGSKLGEYNQQPVEEENDIIQNTDLFFMFSNRV